ncbi:MAG: substrate-binding domain-containing protein [Acidimicrobiales bacterium]
MRRALAVVAAVAMIALAFLVRSRSDTGGGGGDGPATVVCARELAAACQALQAKNPWLTVVTEDANRTLTTLTAAGFDPGAAEIDGWLVPAPFPAMVDETRARTGAGSALGEPTKVLARSPLVIAVWNDRRQALRSRCGEDLTWKCIGEVAGEPWGDVGGQASWGEVKPGLANPAETAIGLLGAGQAAASWFGTSDYAANDFADPAFRAWFERLARASQSSGTGTGTPLDQMLSLGPAAFDLAGSTEAAAGPSISTSRDKDRLGIVYPAPEATADVVLAPVAGSEAGARVKRLFESPDAAAALAGAGWRVDGQPAATGLPPDTALPADDGLPRPGVLQALRSLWEDVTR